MVNAEDRSPPDRARAGAGVTRPGAGGRILRWLVPDANPAGSLFGLITIGVLLAAESARHETYQEVVGSAVVTLLLYWFAHAYTQTLGRRLEYGERLTAGMVAQSLVHNWAIVTGAAIPLVALLIAWVAGATPNTAVNIALWTSAAVLVVIELAAGVRAGAKPRELLFEGSVGAAMGIAIIALRVILG